MVLPYIILFTNNAGGVRTTAAMHSGVFAPCKFPDVICILTAVVCTSLLLNN
jgi:hypothetical protein